MSDVNVVDELNRVAVMHRSSLPTYLADALPWVRNQREGDAEAVRQIASNQQVIVNELCDYILELDGIVESGSFPMQFTAYHDLSFDYLAPRMIADLDQQLAAMQEISQAVSNDARAQGLVDRAIGAAKANIDLLRERSAG